MDIKDLPIEVLRKMVTWFDWHDEDFNFKIKSVEDFIKLWDYSEKHNLGALDWDGLYNELETEEKVQNTMKEIEELLGYQIY